MRNSYLVAYDISNDISNDLRLRRVHKTMVGFGDRLQYSVFECTFSPADLARCKHALGKLIHHREDQVLFVDLGQADGRKPGPHGAPRLLHPRRPCIIVDREPEAGELSGTKRKVESIQRARGQRREGAQEDDE